MSQRQPKPAPIFATAATAARMLDMKLSEFMELVSAGVLPPPRSIGPFARYDMDEIQRVVRGDLIGGGEMEW